MSMLKWLGGSSDRFNDPGNWKPHTVPNSSSDVLIEPSSATTIVAATADINSLVTNANTTLAVGATGIFAIVGAPDAVNPTGASTNGGTFSLGQSAELFIDGQFTNAGLLGTGDGSDMIVPRRRCRYLARGVQRIIETFIALVALASAVGGHGLPLNILGSLIIGWGVTAAVRLVFGSPLGLPSADDVRLLLEEFGIRAGNVCPAARQVWGVAKFEATEEAVPPGRLGVAVYGRDAADARLLTKAGRFLLYRDSGPSLMITRLQQVEHDAYLTLRAAGPASPWPSWPRRERRGRPATPCWFAGCRPGWRCRTRTPTRSATPCSMTCTASC